MHLHKWGNSLGLRVPAQFIKQLQLSETDALEMVVDIEAELLIVRRKPSVRRKKYNLRLLLSKVRPEQLIEEAWDEDSPRGREVW